MKVITFWILSLYSRNLNYNNRWSFYIILLLKLHTCCFFRTYQAFLILVYCHIKNLNSSFLAKLSNHHFLLLRLDDIKLCLKLNAMVKRVWLQSLPFVLNLIFVFHYFLSFRQADFKSYDIFNVTHPFIFHIWLFQ